MKEEIIVKIVVAIIGVVVPIITTFVCNLIKEKIGEIRTKQLFDFIEKAVKWANQTIPKEEWERKGNEVMEKIIAYVNSHTGLAFTEDDLRTIMEAFVIDEKEKKEVKKTTIKKA